MNNYDENNCQLYDTGRFNDIAIAYLVCSLRDAKVSSEDGRRIVDAFCRGMDNMSAMDALQRYRGSVG